MARVDVIMVAEKPSLAQSIARLLAGGEVESRRGTLDVHEWDGKFKGHPAHFKMTSVIGMEPFQVLGFGELWQTQDRSKIGY
jgi:hypothetical protein